MGRPVRPPLPQPQPLCGANRAKSGQLVQSEVRRQAEYAPGADRRRRPPTPDFLALQTQSKHRCCQAGSYQGSAARASLCQEWCSGDKPCTLSWIHSTESQALATPIQWGPEPTADRDSACQSHRCHLSSAPCVQAALGPPQSKGLALRLGVEPASCTPWAMGGWQGSRPPGTGTAGISVVPHQTKRAGWLFLRTWVLTGLPQGKWGASLFLGSPGLFLGAQP